MPSESRFCHECGTTVSTTDSFCSNCGAKFQVETGGKTSLEAIQVSRSAFSDMLKHAVRYYHIEHQSQEVGGLLIGSLQQDGKLLIKKAVPVCEGSAVEVDISTKAPTVFEQLYADGVLKEDEGEFLGGWYHSHPGYSLFLSKTDVETHWNSFQSRNRYSVAIVLDPSLSPESCIAGFRVTEDMKTVKVHLGFSEG